LKIETCTECIITFACSLFHFKGINELRRYKKTSNRWARAFLVKTLSRKS